MTHLVEAQRDGSCFVIRLNRPERKNALTVAMYAKLADLLQEASGDDKVRSVLITGNRDCFTAGNDLTDFLSADLTSSDHPTRQFMHTLLRFDKPLIAAVAGPAIGIGTTLLLHCDFVVAADTSRFQMPFAPLGLCPELGSSLLLERYVGKRKAEELLLLGQAFTAEQAQAWGLLNQVVPGADVMAAAFTYARALDALPQHAIEASRQLLRGHDRDQIAQRIDQEMQHFLHCLQHPETKQRLQAFFER